MQATSQLSVTEPVEMVRNTIRIAAFWLCALLLSWSNDDFRQIAPWPGAVGLVIISSLTITVLGQVATTLRHHPVMNRLDTFGSKRGLTAPQQSIASRVALTGILSLEILSVVSLVQALKSLLL